MAMVVASSQTELNPIASARRRIIFEEGYLTTDNRDARDRAIRSALIAVDTLPGSRIAVPLLQNLRRDGAKRKVALTVVVNFYYSARWRNLSQARQVMVELDEGVDQDAKTGNSERESEEKTQDERKRACHECDEGRSRGG
jgi:hypothetical protein